MKIPQTLVSIAVIIASATSANAGSFFEDVGQAIDKGVKEAGNAIKYSAHEAGQVIEKGAHKRGKLWSSAIYTNDKAGKFLFCTASATYRNGITMIAVLRRHRKWDLGFRSPNWRMQKGANIPIEYRFDRSQRRWAFARVIAPDMAVITMRPNGEMVKLFRHDRMLRIYDGQRHYAFSLTGSSRMLDDLANCLGTRLDAEKSTNGSGNGLSAVPPKPNSTVSMATHE